MAAPARSRVFAEIAIVVGAGVAVLVAARGQWLPSGIKQWLVPSFFLYSSLIACLVTDRDFQAIGLSSPEWKKAGTDLLVYAFVILPVFLFGWWVLARYGRDMRFVFRWPPELATLVVWQVLGVALPEELFFRGWLQGRLNQVLARGLRIFGALIGPGLFIAAALFAGSHLLAYSHPFRLMVFFPGLLFGLFRERSNSVAVPVLAHAVGNIFFIALQSCAVH